MGEDLVGHLLEVEGVSRRVQLDRAEEAGRAHRSRRRVRRRHRTRTGSGTRAWLGPRAGIRAGRRGDRGQLGRALGLRQVRLDDEHRVPTCRCRRAVLGEPQPGIPACGIGVAIETLGQGEAPDLPDKVVPDPQRIGKHVTITQARHVGVAGVELPQVPDRYMAV